MARNSKNSKYEVFPKAARFPFVKTSQTQSLQDQLLETRLRIEQAKLAKLEADIPDPNPKYTRYEDMPPPTPEDEARFEAKFRKLVAALDAEEVEERLDRFR